MIMKKFSGKYRIYTDNKRKVVAVSTYAGKPVRGIATCSPEDTFDLEKGTALAKAKCNMKVAEKRIERAELKHSIASAELDMALDRKNKMREYLDEAFDAYHEAMYEVTRLLIEYKD